MPRLLARLTGNILGLARPEDALLAQARRYFDEAADRESAYARYDTPAYLRRRKRGVAATGLSAAGR